MVDYEIVLLTRQSRHHGECFFPPEQPTVNRGKMYTMERYRKRKDYYWLLQTELNFNSRKIKNWLLASLKYSPPFSLLTLMYK